MSLDIATNFCRGAVSAVANLAATTITYTLSGPASFPVPLAGLYAPDAGYDVTVWASGSYASPDLDPAAAIFRVTAVTSTVLTGYWSEGTAMPTAANTYTVVFGPTAKFRDSLWIPGYSDPSELMFVQNVTFWMGNNLSDLNASGLGYQTIGAAILASGPNHSTEASITFHSGTTADGNVVLYSYNSSQNYAIGTPLPSAIQMAHRLKGRLNFSEGANTDAVSYFGLFTGGSGTIFMGANGIQASSTGFCNLVGFRVDNTVSTTQIACVCRTGTSETTVNFTPAGGLNSFLDIELIATSSQVAFWSDGVNVANITTNIPTAALSFIVGCGTSSTNDEITELEWIKYVRPWAT